MQRNSNTMYTLVGALVISAGFATPMAIADEPESSEVKQSQPEPEVKEAEQQLAEKQQKTNERPNGEMVEVRVSLPDGRTFVRLEPKRNLSARYGNRSNKPVSTSRRLSDGSRISVGSRSVRGGSNSGGRSVGGGGGGGGGSATISRGGGGGGGGGAAATASVEGSGELTTKAQKSSGGGVFSFGPADNAGTDSGAEETGGMYNSTAGSSGGSSGTPSSVVSNGSSSGATSSNSSNQNNSVPTIGEPSYDVEGNATGGQSVKFPNESMFATVIGNRVYFTGVELLTSNQPFEVIVGTLVTSDSVIMDENRQASVISENLTAASTTNSEIVIEFASDTVVDLNMLSFAERQDQPLRSARNWTVRIR
ncbi:MAG: hypothetical protein ACF8MF_00485 [Phycisphaerales bacterium JB052]